MGTGRYSWPLIRGYSPRASKTFLPFNCSATPREMLDAQLFGHRRGAFTGATENFPGVIRAAAGGTLFLDEIGESTMDIQPKLLRFLAARQRLDRAVAALAARRQALEDERIASRPCDVPLTMNVMLAIGFESPSEYSLARCSRLSQTGESNPDWVSHETTGAHHRRR